MILPQNGIAGLTNAIVLFHILSPGGELPWTIHISPQVRTTNCQMYTNISQILLLNKTWGYYSKFDSMKSLQVCYWYVKIPQSGYMEHGSEYITF